MNKKLKIFIMTCVLTLSFSKLNVHAESSIATKVNTTNISTNKEWTVKFNRAVNSDTINTKNIKVVDDKNVEIPIQVYLGANNSSIKISPKVSGYEPNKKYKLIIGKEVKSASGKSLSDIKTLDFSTTNKYEDISNYSDLPEITSVKYEYTPLLPTQKQIFYVNSKNGQDVQYRVFVHGYSSAADTYVELTNGYTSTTDGKINSLKTLQAGTNGQKYKVIVYVKKANSQGNHKDLNTDYDNYYVDYMRCVDKINTENTSYSNYNITLDEMVNKQLSSSDKPVFVESYDFNNEASKNQIKYYINPNNFLDDYGKYQFLKLSYTDGMTEEQVNNILKGKGILEGKGQAFLQAAKDNNVNVPYLVSHALLETGNGTSVLANGGMKDKDGKYIHGVPVYNFFGIEAYDQDPNRYGTEAAYKNKWLTPEDAIKGGAAWISKGYINNPNGKQDTLYKMRWNPNNPVEHQYATDVAWGFKQIPTIMKQIKDILNTIKDLPLIYDIPKFK